MIETIIAMAALATAEFCAEPIEGGLGEPQFCRFEHVQTIHTPWFSVDVPPALLAGVDQSGRRLMALATLRQSAVSVSILASEMRAWSGCRVGESELVIGGMTWSLCDESTPGTVQRRLTASVEDGYLSVFYSYPESGTMYAEPIQQLLRSIRVLP
ncbi:MAG TPA: hypothetical protein VFR29_00850 [Steroidobacteraceae bacterium]|nr:hypothetical protein [Steroidobacteraceae bacterium]